LCHEQVILQAKAAPGYYMAKLIIKPINSVAMFVNSDKSKGGGCLKVQFLRNYAVFKCKKRLFLEQNLSQQIQQQVQSLGNRHMKFALYVQYNWTLMVQIRNKGRGWFRIISHLGHDAEGFTTSPKRSGYNPFII
jgi:hypothetical protein